MPSKKTKNLVGEKVLRTIILHYHAFILQVFSSSFLFRRSEFFSSSVCLSKSDGIRIDLHFCTN